MKFRFLFLIFFIAYCSPVYAFVYDLDIDEKAYLKEGKDELESGKYKDAIFSLFAAEREFPLLGDYALLWLSDAYHETGDHKESLKTIRILLEKYPHSLLKKKARIREVKEAEEVSEENIQQIYESYIKDFPRDAGVKYSYAMWLKKNGKEATAQSVFKEIYLDAGSFSKMAYNELDPSDITVEDLIKWASNLMSKMDFKGAESALRSAMDRDDGRFKNEILKNLGLSLFKQRRYREAADVYEKADRRYWQVRSLYRAGEKEAFNSALDELLKSGDKRAGPILVSVASDERRNGRIKEAIKIYQNVVRKYPSETEDALWGIGWTCFLTGEYRKAADIFTNLYDKYNDTRYLYWKARSLEANGEDALSIYRTIFDMGGKSDFYSIMSYRKSKRSPEQFNIYKSQKFFGTAAPVRENPIKPQKNDRVEALFDLGLSKEALLELIYISRNTSSMEDILYICSKLQELGEYKYLVRTAMKVPHMEELLRFRYPLAYWDVVDGLSGKYSIDPLLVLSVVREESRFDSEARSPAGALGLMQIIPGTAYRLDNNLKLGINGSYEILDVKNNLHLGIFYLKNLIDEFGSYSHALAAYNAGEKTVRKWLRRGNYKSSDEFIEDIPYSETRNYVKRVITNFFEYKRISSIEDGMIKFSLEKL